MKKAKQVAGSKLKGKSLKVGKLKSSKVKSSKKEKPSNPSINSGQRLQTFKPETNKPSNLKPATLTLLRILAVLAVIGITVYIYSIRDRVEEFTQYGYAGIFLVMILANATIFLPAPGVAIVFAMGSVFNPIGVALAAGAGGALGESTGYLAGFGGQAIVENTKIYNRFLPWIQKYGAWAIMVLSAIPNPFFDLAGVAAGIAKIPLWKFLLACWVGQTIKMAMFAYAGYYSIDWVASFYD